MNAEQWLDACKQDKKFIKQVTYWHTVPAQCGKYSPFPEDLNPELSTALSNHGINKLYSHQAECFRLAKQKKDFVVVTPTASGKTLCYNLPVLSQILEAPESRALYIFPTKALSADQVSGLLDLTENFDIPIKTSTYDGDTPGAARKSIRDAGHIVVTNPDMLHSNIMPHHTKWIKLFENLKFIVIDEIHAYRGIFGSNFANVLRRLLRLCAFYGSKPQFILCSATIANPVELASELTGRDIVMINNNGSPVGSKHFIFYNPPIVNKTLGIRTGAVKETRKIAISLLKNHIPTIVFARSRLQVEVIVKHLKDKSKNILGNSNSVRGYRSGYLPTERRAIEKGLRDGSVQTVVSTNALELGVDIGSLTACILCGYPGTIAATWQQAGRAGRRNDTSLTIVVANSSAINQYMIKHPDYFFKSSPEHALISPNNMFIVLSHIKCSAYELPFKDGEKFGNVSASSEYLNFLEEANILRHTGGSYHWMSEDFPASEISLRSATAENFAIIDITNPAHHKVIGEMDRFTVPMLLHENAIYMHEAKQYQVEKLDFKACKAFIRHVDVDYYTDADLNVSLSLLDTSEINKLSDLCSVYKGEVKITAIVKMFKKMKLDTNENLGYGPVRLPESEMHTTAMWWTFDEKIFERFNKETLQSGMMAVTNLLRILSPIYLMCDSRDFSIVYQVKSPETDLPTIFLYDLYPGGIGLSEKAYTLQNVLLKQGLDILNNCSCVNGCPACVGPIDQIGENGKRTAELLLKEMLKWQ